MGKEPMISLSIHPDKMKNKNYDISVVALATLDCEWLDDDKSRKIAKTEFRARLKTVLKMTNYKIKIVVNTLIDLRVMDEDDNCYVINAVEAPFVRLNISTVRFCLENLDPLSFKVYCYLANKFNIHRTYGITENYFFSAAELISVIGYGRNHQSHIKMLGILELLEGIGLIQYSEESVGRPGKHGTYHELYNVVIKISID